MDYSYTYSYIIQYIEDCLIYGDLSDVYEKKREVRSPLPHNQTFWF